MGTSNEKNLVIWQNRILPFAIFLLLILTAAFVTLYFFEVKKIQDSFLGAANYDALSISEKLSKQSKSINDKLFDAELFSLLNRHYNASLVIKSRILTLNLSFLTGMILCFMGGLFVLGKFSESPTSVGSDVENVKISIVSSSPGIVLSFLGVCLICISILSQVSVKMEDKAVYIQSDDIAPTPGEVQQSDSAHHVLNTIKNITNKPH